MSRERLTSRTAEDLKAKAGTQVSDKGTGIDNDTAAVNNPEHTKNDPKIDQYAKGDPSAWGEDVNKDDVNKDDAKREDTGHAPLIDKHAAAQAVASAKRLEEKAVKCIIAAQRILPGAAEEMIEKQAAIFMHLPEEGLNATLTNQEELAKQISRQASKTAGDAEHDEGEKGHEEKETEEERKKEEECLEKKEVAKKELEEKRKKLEELKKEAATLERELTAGQNADAMKNNPQGKKTEKKAGDEEKKEEKEDVSKEEVKEEEKEKKEEKDVSKEEVKEEEKEKKEEIEASDSTLLDQIFGEVTASETKKGAAKLSGMVKKQASEQVSELSGIWASAPDVSTMF